VPSDNPYERRVSKRYRASNGDTRTVYGTFRFEDYDATMEAMKRREIQSLDPRIEWDEELGPQFTLLLIEPVPVVLLVTGSMRIFRFSGSRMMLASKRRG